MITPGRAERLLLRFSPRLWQILLIILIGLAVLTVFSIRFADRLEDARSSQSDNTTWLLSQLEVEALKVERAVAEARLEEGTPGVTAIRSAFDIYISRVRVVSGNLMQSVVLKPIGESEEWVSVRQVTQDLLQLIDVPDDQLRKNLPEIALHMIEIRQPMRAAVVNSLRHIIEAGSDSRAALAMLFTRSAVVAAGLIVLLFLTIWSTSLLTESLRQRTYEAERARSNLERSINASLDGVIVARADGRVQNVNPAAEAILGYDRAALLATTRIVSLLLPDALHDMQTDLVRNVLRDNHGGTPIPEGRIELLAQRSDGKTIPIELSLTRDRDSDGAMIYIAFLRDISERRRYETSLREARDSALLAAEAKSRFLAMMSHEMRTPLNGVIAALDILRETTRLSARQARFLGIAEASAATALSQIGDVLELARLDGEHARESASVFNLVQVIRGLAEQASALAARQGNRIELDLPAEDQAWISAPRRGVSRVVMNLVGNATKFTTKGTIRIAAALEPDGPHRVIARLSVSDTGIGIAQDKLEAIFDPFETLDTGYDRETEGTGLGLGIARRTLEQMGGEISVESTPGKGSAFRFSMPVESVPAPAEPAETPGQIERIGLPRLRVLIVEDNHVNRLVLLEMLRHLGQGVTEAVDGAQAIAEARAREFDLIFMDVSMPGIDGLAATAAIRREGASRHARIIGLTAHGLDEDLERFRRAGLAEVMNKPVTIGALIPWLAGTGTPNVTKCAAPDTLDGRIVEELCRLLEVETRQTLLQGFLAEGDEFLAALASGAAGDELTRRLHKLKGAASVIGASGFAHCLEQCETAVAAGGGGDVLPEIRAAWARLRDSLPRQFLGAGQTSRI